MELIYLHRFWIISKCLTFLCLSLPFIIRCFIGTFSTWWIVFVHRNSVLCCATITNPFLHADKFRFHYAKLSRRMKRDIGYVKLRRNRILERVGQSKVSISNVERRSESQSESKWRFVDPQAKRIRVEE